MKKMESIEVGKLARGTILYALKMCVFSIVAAIPTYIAHGKLLAIFEGRIGLIAYGAPIIISALIFATIGVAELIITRDEVISVILKKVKK